jgi:hypothetical protein
MSGEQYYRNFSYQPRKGSVRRRRITMTISCDTEMRDALNEFAKRHKIPVTEAIRTLVEWGLETTR